MADSDKGHDIVSVSRQPIAGAMLEKVKLYNALKVSVFGVFWSVFSSIWTEYGEIRSISPYSVRMRNNTDQKTPNTDTFHAVLISPKKYLNLVIKGDGTSQEFPENICSRVQFLLMYTYWPCVKTDGLKMLL